MSGLHIGLPAAAARPAATAGDCELCGRWDSALSTGVCADCAQRHGVVPLFPAHQHLWQLTMDALEALLVLNESGGIVAGIEVGGHCVLVRLTRAPRPGQLSGVHEVCARECGQPVRLGRSVLAIAGRKTVVCEWRLP